MGIVVSTNVKGYKERDAVHRGDFNTAAPDFIIRIRRTVPKAPCSYIVHTLALKYRYGDYFKSYVYTI